MLGTPLLSAAPGTAGITGAGMGIGRAIALRLARDGWAVAVNDVESARAAAVTREVAAAGTRVADVGELGVEWHLMSATAVMAIIPALVVTLFAQRYVVPGLRL